MKTEIALNALSILQRKDLSREEVVLKNKAIKVIEKVLEEEAVVSAEKPKTEEYQQETKED